VVWFQAALNRKREALWGEIVSRVRGLLPRAVEVLECELESGKRKTQVALALLRLAGIPTPAPQKPMGNHSFFSFPPDVKQKLATQEFGAFASILKPRACVDPTNLARAANSRAFEKRSNSSPISWVNYQSANQSVSIVFPFGPD
jgi:hypothetical protein